MTRLGLFLRGLCYVALVACNTAVIAACNVPLAFLVGGLVSYTWTGNVQAQGTANQGDRLAYTLGAGTGTVLGMVIGRWLA